MEGMDNLSSVSELNEENFNEFYDSIADILAVSSFNPAALQDEETKKIIDNAVKLGIVDAETLSIKELTDEEYKKIVNTSANKPAAAAQASVVTAAAKPEKTEAQQPAAGKPNMFSKAAPSSEDEITPETLLPQLSKYMGMEVKDSVAAKTLFESIKKFRNDSQKVSDLQTKLAENEQLYTKLPLQLKNVVAEFINGGDWKDLMSSAAVNLDFTQGADKQDAKALVKFYHKDETFVEEDFTEEGLKDKRMQLLLNLAKKQFNSDKSSIETERARIIKEADENKARFVSSIESSVQTLRSEFPFFGENEVSSISSVLSTPGKLKDVFYNQDGTFKAEAAKRLAFALYGEDALVNTERQTAANTESEINTRKVIGGKKAPEAAASSPEAAAELENIKKQLQTFSAGANNPY
jgi:hypothetical protein